MALGDIQIDQQTGHRFGAHAGTSICVQAERALCDVLALGSIFNQLRGKLRALTRCDKPAHHVAAKDVQNHIEVKVTVLSQ